MGRVLSDLGATTIEHKENDVKIFKWTAVAFTALFALMNLGVAPDSSQADGLRILGVVLGVAGVAAAVGLATSRTWGRTAVVAVGALNVAAATVGLVVDAIGVDTGAAATGLVLGVICVALGVLTQPTAVPQRVAA